MPVDITESGHIDHPAFSEDGFLCRDGGQGTYSALKALFSQTTDPGVNDDSNAGWVTGSQWLNVNNDKLWVCVDSSVGAAIWKEATAAGGAGSATPTYELAADQLLSPNSSDWAVNALAPLDSDPTNAAISVRRFDDTTEEGVGFQIDVPSGVTNMKVKVRWRAITGASNKKVGLKLYNRGIPNNAAVQAWSAAHQMSDLVSENNTNFQYDEETLSLATLGVTAGELTQFELTRDDVNNPSLVGDIALASLVVEFS